MNAKLGYELLCKHDYAKAESAFEQDYSLYPEGGTQTHEPVRYGIALMAQGKYTDAANHIVNNVIPKRTNSNSCHELLLGIAAWYTQDYQAAIDFWMSALKSQYAADKGFSDVIGMLHFASVHKPRLMPKVKLQELLIKYRQRLYSESFVDKLFAFLLDVIDECELMGYTILHNLGFNEFNVQKSGISVLSDRGRAYYHMALKKYHKTNLREYTNNMRMCVGTAYEHYHIEFLIASLEVHRLDQEYPVEYFKKL